MWTKSPRVILSVLDLFLHVKFARLNLGWQTPGQQRKPSSVMLPRSKVPAEKYITVGLSELPDTECGFTVTFMVLQYIEIQSLVNMQEGKLKSSQLPFIPDGFYRLLRFTFSTECICSFKIYHNNSFCY